MLQILVPMLEANIATHVFFFCGKKCINKLVKYSLHHVVVGQTLVPILEAFFDSGQKD